MQHDRRAQDHRTAQQRAFHWAGLADEAARTNEPSSKWRAMAEMWARVAAVLEPQTEPITAELHQAEPAPCHVVVDLTSDLDVDLVKAIRRMTRPPDNGPEQTSPSL